MDPVTDMIGLVFLLVCLLAIVVIALLPAIIAFSKGHRHRWAILVLDVSLGWTGLGYIGALIWALI